MVYRVHYNIQAFRINLNSKYKYYINIDLLKYNYNDDEKEKRISKRVTSSSICIFSKSILIKKMAHKEGIRQMYTF